VSNGSGSPRRRFECEPCSRPFQLAPPFGSIPRLQTGKSKRRFQKGWAVNFSGELLTSGIGTTEADEIGQPIIDDELWTLIQPLLPRPKPQREKNPYRLPVSNRAALTGILFALKTRLRWRDLPVEMGCSSGVTCWRRLRDWQAVGVWDRLHALLLAKLRAADQIDFSRAAVDSSSIRAVGAG
jgi:transposase